MPPRGLPRPEAGCRRRARPRLTSCGHPSPRLAGSGCCSPISLQSRVPPGDLCGASRTGAAAVARRRQRRRCSRPDQRRARAHRTSAASPAGSGDRAERLGAISRSSPALSMVASTTWPQRTATRCFTSVAKTVCCTRSVRAPNGGRQRLHTHGRRLRPELWGYLPGSLLPALAHQPFADPGALTGVHVDGSPLVADLFIDSNVMAREWRTLLSARRRPRCTTKAWCLPLMSATRWSHGSSGKRPCRGPLWVGHGGDARLPRHRQLCRAAGVPDRRHGRPGRCPRKSCRCQWQLRNPRLCSRPGGRAVIVAIHRSLPRRGA